MKTVRFVVECDFNDDYVVKKALARLKREMPDPSVAQVERAHREMELDFVIDVECALSDALAHKEYLLGRPRLLAPPDPIGPPWYQRWLALFTS